LLLMGNVLIFVLSNSCRGGIRRKTRGSLH
jgi:hypothetical protein